jgi:two-component system phosphate regulon response regulator PhoB
MATGKSILIVEDEADLADLLRFNLSKEGYVCRCVYDGIAALAEVRREAPDLVILDRMLPGMSGEQVMEQVRRNPQTTAIPILMLTAKAEESDQLVGFALGASDYVTKPFSMKVLLARVAAALRREESSAAQTQPLTMGPITLDPERYQVSVDGAAVTLTMTEFRILKTLMSAGGRVLDRSRLIDAVLGPMVAVTDRTIDVHIASLRKKLGTGAAWVQTVRGVGYTFREPQPGMDQ